MQTIIVATDYSVEATNAMNYAAEMARHFKARLILFNAYQLPENSPATPLSHADLERHLLKNKTYLQTIANRLQLQHNIKVDCWTSLTYVAEELEMLVNHYKADLVVMGMWKKGQLDLDFGNTTTFVISQAKYPILVVPEGLQFMGMSNILFSWDPASIKMKSTLDSMKKLAIRFGAKVQILHIEKTIDKNKETFEGLQEALEASFENIKHKYKYIQGEDIIAGIEASIKKYNSDLLVMVPNRSGTTTSAVHESRTLEMALRTKVPLLALPN